MRILVVEDEKDLRNIIKKRLVREHYSVDVCGDGEEALDYMEMTSYDGILLDIMLPGKDGFTVLKEVRQTGNDTPILLLTARDGIDDRVKGLDLGADVLVAAHRGFWGDNLGAGYPENSTGAFEAAQKYTDVLETDIMMTKDKRMVISHDYSLSRLSNYPGPLTDYLFDLNSSILNGLLLRKRNTDISVYPYLFFENLVDILLQKHMVLTVDIKDIRARVINGQCVANCDYDTKLHGDSARLKIKESWMICFQTCIQIAEEKNALQYLAFKTPYTYAELAAYVPESTLCKILFMPVIQPKRKDFLNFTDDWINHGGKKVIAYETNFLNERDPYLKSFTRDGVTYKNLLHYVLQKTGLRSGCYPEEPIGQKGTVTRFVDWKMKYTVNDRRGDHYWLMAVPYGKIMVMTSDRPDIWYKVNQIYNMTGQ